MSQELSVKRREPIACGAPRNARALHPALDSRPSALDSRNGLTLIELLIAIAIIATLAAMFLGASRAAMESSRASRTKSTISKLHTLLMEQWASYETRRVDLSDPVQSALNSMPISTPDQYVAKSNATHDCRLVALRELMKFEMPDRWSDVTGVQPGNAPLLEDEPGLVVFLRDLPTLAKIYRRRYIDSAPSETFEGAECLYMIIMYACGDGEARTMFTARDIGDVDEDGAPEFLDGWGNPIQFVRWPAGFVTKSFVMSGDAEVDHDPYDPFRRDQPTAFSAYAANSAMAPYLARLRDNSPAFRLVPLVYSAGPDGEYEIDVKADAPTSSPTGTVRLDPYATEADNTFAFGTPEDFNGDGDDNSIDNIHNHLQDR